MCINFVTNLSLGVINGLPSSSSLLYEIASMMQQNSVEELGSCGRKCCVELDGDKGEKETRLLDIDQSISVEDDPCKIHTCTVRL